MSSFVYKLQMAREKCLADFRAGHTHVLVVSLVLWVSMYV